MPNDFDTLPSPSGQNTGIPHKTGPAHPLGPYAPKQVASDMPHNHPHGAGESFGLPTANGQYPHAGKSAGHDPNLPKPYQAPPQKGGGGSASWGLPSPSGQYQHAKSQDASHDGGGKG